jgi:hypothetical protein
MIVCGFCSDSISEMLEYPKRPVYSLNHVIRFKGWILLVHYRVMRSLGYTAMTSRVQENQLSVYEEIKLSGVQGRN